MKIEVGKYYRLRDGTEVGPLMFDVRKAPYPFFANGHSWTEYGDLCAPNARRLDAPDGDIVSEVPAPPNYSLSPMTHSVTVKPGDAAGYAMDPALRVSETGGVKASIGKRPLHLLPRDAIEAVADVMALGAAKYGDRNWERGLSVSDLVRAADGHLWDWFLRRNDGRDPQFGTSHLAHAACCVLFLLAHELRGLPDDRPSAVPAVPRPMRED